MAGNGISCSCQNRFFSFSYFSFVLRGGKISVAGPTDGTSVVHVALQKLDATKIDDWYFTMEVLEEGELLVIHNDPRREAYEKRQLITVNGATPAEHRLQEFRDAEIKRIDDLDPDTSSYGYLVDVETLKLINTSADQIRYAFLPKIKAMEDMREQLHGTLLLNIGTQQIEEIEITNTEVLSPAFSVKVNTYRLGLTFKPEHEEVLLQKLESHAAGTVGFLKNFDTLTQITFSDYARADH